MQLKTWQGTELLIQSENDGVVGEWFRALQDSISTHVSEGHPLRIRTRARRKAALRCLCVRLRPGSPMRPSRRTCPSPPWTNTTRTKSTERQRRPEVCVDPNATRTRLPAAVVVDQLSCLSPPAAMKPSASMDSSDNKKTRHKLKKFLTRRPTLQSVRDKGYIKGSVRGLSRRPRPPCCSA